MSYKVSLNNNKLAVSLSRTGGQGSKGDSVSSASIDSNGDFHIIITDAAGNQVSDTNLGGANIVASATTAATNAQTALDTFDDRFLGAKSSAPTLDNDGDALITGALFFNTATSQLGVYNGTAWEYPALEAQTSATASAASATSAASSLSQIGTSVSDAANSASSAAASATSATSSATSASNTLASIQTVFDNFDDRFLGTKSSDPSVDNDGNTLLEGAMYYNSSTNDIKFYNGTSWEAPSVSAANSATAAATSASSASTSATSAASSATSAANNASTVASNLSSVESLFDTFDDRFLGAKSSNPSTDNDGNALLEGTMYFDTTNNVIKFYNGTSWVAPTTDANNSATAAASSATAAASSATAAAASATAAAASADTFDDTYLGSKSSDPSVDNDGNALQTGALYFNTSTDTIRVYTGSAWSNTLKDLVDDATPQLGGNLDLNGNDIITTSNGNIDLDPNGSGKVVFKGNATKGSGQFVLNCENNSHGITVKGPPHSAGASYTLTLPNTSGSTGQFLKTDGSGNLSFDTVSTDLVADTTPQLGGNLDTNSNNITFSDSSRAIFGAGSDIQIYHDGTDSHIDYSKKLSFTPSGGADLSFNGTSYDTDWMALGHWHFKDGTQARFGNSDDLKIYSDGSNSIIQGTGTTYFRGSTVIIGANGGSGGFETGIRVNEVSSETSNVELYYDNSKVFETTSSGVQTTGTVNVNGAYTLPTSDGTTNQVLTTDGSGAVTFADAGGGADLYAANPSSATDPTATGTNAVGVGNDAVASGNNSIALGDNATSAGVRSAALMYSHAGGTDSFAAGIANSSSSRGAQAANAVAIGSNAYVQGTEAIGLGYYATIGSSGTRAVALGHSYANGTDSFAAQIGSNSSSYGATGNNATAVGILTKATGLDFVFGRSSIASGGSGSLSLGMDNTSSGGGAVTLGKGNTASHTDAVVIGQGASSSAADQITLGHTDQTVRISSAYTLPAADGSANQVLTTNGSGAVTFGVAPNPVLYSANESTPQGAVTVSNTSSAPNSIAFDTDNSKICVAHPKSTGAANGASLTIGTISNNSVTYGSAVDIYTSTSSQLSEPQVVYIGSGKFVVSYLKYDSADGSRTYGFKVVTVSGTTATIGSETALSFPTGQSPSYGSNNNRMAADPANTGNFVFTWSGYNGGNSTSNRSQSWAVAGSISGSTITLGSNVQLTNASGDSFTTSSGNYGGQGILGLSYDATRQKFLVAYQQIGSSISNARVIFKTLTLGGTGNRTITAGSQTNVGGTDTYNTPFHNGLTAALAYNSTVGRHLLHFFSTGDYTRPSFQIVDIAANGTISSPTSTPNRLLFASSETEIDNYSTNTRRAFWSDGSKSYLFTKAGSSGDLTQNFGIIYPITVPSSGSTLTKGTYIDPETGLHSAPGAAAYLGSGSFALGYLNNSAGTSDTKIIAASTANTVTGDNAVAIGSINTASHATSIVIGEGASSSASDQITLGNTSQSVRISSAYTLPSSDGTNGQVLTTDGSGAVTFADAGGGADLYAANPVSATDPTAQGDNSIAIGSGANDGNSGYDDAIAIGTSALAEAQRSVSIGKSTNSGTGSVAIGSSAHGGGNTATAVGGNTDARSVYATAIGAYAQAWTGWGATAIAKSYASGTDSFAAVITNNSSSYGSTGSYSVAIGYQAKASGSYSFAAGGEGNLASGYGAIAMGRNSTASGDRGIAIGDGCTAGATVSSRPNIAIGHGATATGGSAIAIGDRANTNGIYGKMSHSSGYAAGTGTAQSGSIVLYGATTDATPKAICSGAGANNTADATNQVVLPNNSAYFFSGTIIAREQASAGTDVGAWEIKGAIRREANAASTVLIKSTIDDFNVPTGWVVALTADTTNGGLAITVTGAAATNIRWVATVNTSEVTY